MPVGAGFGGGSVSVAGGSAPSSVSLDNSSGTIQLNPPGNTYRGIGSDWFNKRNKEKEDFMRNEIAKQNDYVRELAVLQKNQDFNSAEAQKERDWSERMRDTSYLSMMNQMKESGINPVLAYQSNAASAPVGASASSSRSHSGSGSGYRSSGSSDDGLGRLLVGAAKIIAGLVGKNAETVASGFTDITTSWNDGNGTTTMRQRTYDDKNKQKK